MRSRWLRVLLKLIELLQWTFHSFGNIARFPFTFPQTCCSLPVDIQYTSYIAKRDTHLLWYAIFDNDAEGKAPLMNRGRLETFVSCETSSRIDTHYFIYIYILPVGFVSQWYVITSTIMINSLIKLRIIFYYREVKRSSLTIRYFARWEKSLDRGYDWTLLHSFKRQT